MIYCEIYVCIRWNSKFSIRNVFFHKKFIRLLVRLKSHNVESKKFLNIFQRYGIFIIRFFQLKIKFFFTIPSMTQLKVLYLTKWIRKSHKIAKFSKYINKKAIPKVVTTCVRINIDIFLTHPSVITISVLKYDSGNLCSANICRLYRETFYLPIKNFFIFRPLYQPHPPQNSPLAHLAFSLQFFSRPFSFEQESF